MDIIEKIGDTINEKGKAVADKAKELARELILKFQADKASKKAQRAMGRCPI